LKNGPEALVIQRRDLLILRSLGTLRILDRVQIEQLAGFHSISRVNVRLSKLRKAGLIYRYYTATSTGGRRSVYSLSKRGALEVHAPSAPLKWRRDSFVLGNAFVAHQLGLNDLIIAASGEGIRWQRPSSILSPTIRLIPDAYIADGERSFFVELDLGSESLSVWTEKTSAYVKLAVTGEFRNVIPHSQFAVMVVADDDSRLETLRRHISKQTQKLFWFSTLDTIKRQGFWSASWLRATGEIRSLPGA